jgi:RNA polymerase sigma factor (sigma-70 family)
MADNEDKVARDIEARLARLDERFRPSPEQIAFVKNLRREHHERLIKILMHLLRSRPDLENRCEIAEELAHSVYLNLLRYQLPPGIRIPVAYMTVTARRVFLEYVGRLPRDPVSIAEPSEEPLDEARYERPDEREATRGSRLEALDAAITLLPAADQEIIKMRLKPMSERSIAKNLGITTYKLKKRLQCIYARLRELIEDEDVIQGRVRT